MGRGSLWAFKNYYLFFFSILEIKKMEERLHFMGELNPFFHITFVDPKKETLN
jgi:hypothetical protein